MTNYISRLLRRRLQRRRFTVSTPLVSLLLLYLVSISATVESIAQSSHQFSTYRQQPQQQQQRRRRGILVDLPTAAAAQPCQRYRTHHSKVRPNDDDDDDTENATQSGDLLRTLGGFVPFFSSQLSPPKQQPIEQNVSGGFWGGLFRRDSNTNTATKKVEPNDQATQPNNKTMKKNRRDRIVDTSESSSTFQRIQALIPLNSKKPDLKADKSIIQPENTNYNPLSVVQKFAKMIRPVLHLPRKHGILFFPKHASCRVKWYPSLWQELICSSSPRSMDDPCIVLPIRVRI
jgi:hypothetical protein